MLMAKLYSKKPNTHLALVPKEDTIKFLLNYSKALSVIKYNKLRFDSLLN